LQHALRRVLVVPEVSLGGFFLQPGGFFFLSRHIPSFFKLMQLVFGFFDLPFPIGKHCVSPRFLKFLPYYIYCTEYC
jgi:hypothetical protein